MGLFDRSNKDAPEGKEPRHDDQRHPEASGADSGGLGGDPSWIEEEEARDQSQRPWDPDGRTDLPEPRGSDARVTSEAPDRADYDPSGTGKSVCIKHMVGLLYPDDGDVLVHGESVPNMVDDRLFEVRKKFGVLFQDGALFGSMNVLDNVAFPLRQHTDKGEDEIDEICRRRLGEVGLS